ncbi:MAG: S8 family serine peptidase [Chitinophagaceae bacterium]
MEPSLVDGTFPSWTVKTAGTVDVWINFPASFSFEDVSNELQAKNIDVIATTWKEYRIIGLRIASARLRELASFPFIEYIEPAPKEDEPVNNKSTVNARATILQSSLPGQRNLLGQGITIGIGDDSNPLNHIDFTGRLINRAPIPGGFHGVHVIGTTAGAGIIDERFSGYAPKATIVSQAFSNILAYAPAYVQDFNMVITNNSYGNVVNDCASFGVYDLYSRVMDQQMLRMPNLQHVFAAGNSGGYNCSPYLAGFSNVLGGYQTAKNTISVGNTSELGVIAAGSSKGPVRDGRIKPEISAQGSRVMSTYPGNGYILNSGTSMSSPAVAGGLGLLYQRYKQLHSGNNPRNGLMKALLCNGATDMGNPGPDYSYGFGWMNLLRSVKMIENNNYYTSSVNLNATNTHTVTIPSGIAQLKVMLYWNDSAAAVLASRALVNDLDLQVTGPSATVYYPQLLDTTPVNVNNVATTGPDHINNIEQVVVNNPGAGTYTFSVKGTTIPFASQYEYFLVYDTIPVSATLTYPAGGEHLQATDSIYISWDAYGNTSNDFKIQYSLDNGASWIDINTSVAANLRQLKWFAPSVTTNQAKVKLIHNGTGIESTSAAFTIVGVPAISLSPVQCEGYISLNWPAVAGATDYEVMMLRGDEMVSMGTTVSTMYTISGLSKDSLYFVSVRARVNGSPGRRATAISRQPNNGTCTGTISDNDLKVDAIISPASSGRKFTSTELSNNISITIRLKNLDDVATSGNIPVAYKIGTNPAVNEIITAPNIGAGATYNYTFTVPVDMSSVGSYNLQASVSYPGDPVTTNDTLRKTFKQLDNTVINLTTDFLDNFEAAPEQSFTVLSQMGLEGLDRYDFVTNTIYGRIRSFVNSGIAYSGSKALTLDADRYNAGGTTDSLKGTFNLGSYNANTDDIRLDFMFKHHAQLPNPANKVWIRGDDQKPWILVYDLYANQDDHGVFKKSPSIELGDLLLANSQNFSSSFQVRWGQWGQILTADNDNAAGYTFDDIHLYKAINDIQMVSIDTPIVASCGLQGNVPVRITVRNSANSIISNIPVSFKVDNTATVTETIASIPANTSVTYTFTATTSNLSAEGSHTVKVWADLPSDNYRKNDTATTVLYNSPIISTFPYLQNFESGAGSWFTNGKNSSWEYGTPTSQKINRAANGSKAWKTRLSGSYNDNEMSYLYSPCFNLSGLTNPTLSLSVALDLEDCGSTLCDAAYVEYSVNGLTWTKLGTNGAGTNWYNKNYSGAHLWSVQNYTRWHVATIPLPTGGSRMQLRFVMSSDPYTSFEGIAVDDIHIYDNTMGIYDGVTMVSPVSQPVSGSNWINFTSGGKLIAAVQPNNQNMGATDVQAYINSGAVRTDLNQYYHNRNITIKPAITNLTDSASVRFYFLDTESESLINATGCAGCSKPGTAYELGIPKYGDINDAVENGTIADNTKGIWSFISAAQAVKVPFDKGYYAEFKVKNFSEFWLKKEAFNRVTPPLTQVINFTAAKQSNDVLVQWTVSIAGYADKFEIEVAKGNAQYQLNNFSKIGEATSTGIALQQYQYTDIENNKSGVRYYRLKIINSDGTFFYSEVKAVVFSDELTWQVYPNPSSGIFNLVYQKNEGEPIAIKVYDVYGRMIKQLNFAGNGFVQKSQIDLSNPQFGSGMYMVEVTTAEKKQVFKLLKQ